MKLQKKPSTYEGFIDLNYLKPLREDTLNKPMTHGTAQAMVEHMNAYAEHHGYKGRYELREVPNPDKLATFKTYKVVYLE